MLEVVVLTVVYYLIHVLFVDVFLNALDLFEHRLLLMLLAVVRLLLLVLQLVVVVI